MQLWHIAALLIAGMVVGIRFPGRFTTVFPAATLYVFLPALIFEGAWYLDLRIMRRTWKPIALLAVPGVLITTGIIALAMHYIASLPWLTSLLLGSILSATDPVAVVAIFRRLDVPKPLATIVESESLLNDAIAVVLYRGVLMVILYSMATGVVSRAVGEELFAIAMGVVLGGIFAYAAAFALRDRIGAAVQSGATFIGAYGAYASAEHFGWSGIFAVLTFGIALRELERRYLSVASAEGVAHFWHWTSTFANVVLFFLIGAALDFTRLAHSLPAAIVSIAAVALSRAVVAYGLLHIVRHHVGRIWQTVIRMAGIRGALALALALATPSTVVDRSQVIDATFTVVIITIIVASLTLNKRLSQLPLEKG